MTVAVLAGLVAAGDLDPASIHDAIERFGVDPEAVNPVDYESGPLG